jgi:hypothetical protein
MNAWKFLDAVPDSKSRVTRCHRVSVAVRNEESAEVGSALARWVVVVVESQQHQAHARVWLKQGLQAFDVSLVGPPVVRNAGGVHVEPFLDELQRMPEAVQHRVDPRIPRLAVTGAYQMDMTVPDFRQVKTVQGAHNGGVRGDTLRQLRAEAGIEETPFRQPVTMPSQGPARRGECNR